MIDRAIRDGYEGRCGARAARSPPPPPSRLRPRPGGGFGGFGRSAARGGGPRGRGRKARRGDIRTAALLLLAEEPRNGYQIMQEVEERSDGVWRPSPGSVYPALQQLEDEGLIRSRGDRRAQAVRADRRGTQRTSRSAASDAPAPWEQMSGDVSDQAHELGKLIREVASAFVAGDAHRQRGADRRGAQGARADPARPLPDPRRRRPPDSTVDDDA